MQKLKTGDEVIVTAGKNKGNRGSVIRVFPNGRVKVEGINMVKKHVKANPNANEQGGIIEKEAPLDISNVAIYNSESGKADRVGIRLDEDGSKVRFFKSNGELVDV
ncbi:MAG: 50S ribosomal protein L24 [Gammaproteobacteria bacterium]|nr:50S ribosomal protein L24 [Gammaproteobacteria bacterium]